MPNPEPSRTLNARQLAFAHHYAAIPNASRAAREAGYSPATAAQQGYALLRNPHVQAEVQRLRDEALADLGIDRLYILGQLKNIADGEVKYETRDGEEIPAPTKDSDRIRALELLGKYQGLWVDRVQHEGEVTFTLDIPRPAHLSDNGTEPPAQLEGVDDDEPEP